MTRRQPSVQDPPARAARTLSAQVLTGPTGSNSSSSSSNSDLLLQVARGSPPLNPQDGVLQKAMTDEAPLSVEMIFYPLHSPPLDPISVAPCRRGFCLEVCVGGRKRIVVEGPPAGVQVSLRAGPKLNSRRSNSRSEIIWNRARTNNSSNSSFWLCDSSSRSGKNVHVNTNHTNSHNKRVSVA